MAFIPHQGLCLFEIQTEFKIHFTTVGLLDIRYVTFAHINAEMILLKLLNVIVPILYEKFHLLMTYARI